MKCRGTGGDCEREAVCRAEGLCNYTGSPLIDTRTLVLCVGYQDGCPHRDRCAQQGDCMGRPSATQIDPRTQPANPKQAYGDKKIPLYLLPFSFAANVCVALYEGMTKYGLVNWRVAKVEAMTYASACKRHVDKWINGEECDPDTRVRHLANAGACIAILIDAEVCGTLIDNRPYPVPQDNLDKMITELEATLAHLKVLHSDRDPKHYYITDVVESL